MIEVCDGTAEWRWLHERTKFLPTPAFRAVAAVEGGAIRAMIGFDNWTPAGASVHIAADDPRALARILRPACRYFFEKADRKVAIAMLPEHAGRALRFARGVGFEERCLLPDAWGRGDAVVVLDLRKENCRCLSRP